MRISDWSSDVCSSDLPGADGILFHPAAMTLTSPIGKLCHLYVRPHEGLGKRCSRRSGGHFPSSRQFAQATRRTQSKNADSNPSGSYQSEIDRASCRARGCQYTYMTVVADSLRKNKKNK